MSEVQVSVEDRAQGTYTVVEDGVVTLCGATFEGVVEYVRERGQAIAERCQDGEGR